MQVDMKKLIGSLVAVVILGGLAYWAASHHVVRTDEGTLVLAKRFLTYADTYVDVRAWSSADFAAHPELWRALVDQGYQDLLAKWKARERKASLDEVKDKAAALAGEVAAKVSATAADVAADVSEKAEEVAGKIAETVEPLLDDPSGADHAP